MEGDDQSDLFKKCNDGTISEDDVENIFFSNKDNGDGLVRHSSSILF